MGLNPSSLKYNIYCIQVGRWTTEQSSGKTCLSACTRQENPVSTSTSKFPNKRFLNNPEFIVMLQKLFWSCHRNETRFGPKRRLIDIEYPNLCAFYDQFVYNNQQASNDLGGDALLVHSIPHFLFNVLDMNTTQVTSFRKEVMIYATNNLIMISAHIDSPYVSMYETSQVSYCINSIHYWLMLHFNPR